MKKIFTFLLCLNIVLSAAACTKADRPDNIDNSSQPGVSETVPGEKSEISTEEALDIAKEYWGKFEIEKNGHMVYEIVRDSAPDSVYVFVIKHLVDMGDESIHYSTFDEVWVDKITGEATPPYDTKPGLMFDYDEVLWCYKYAVDYYNLDSYKIIDNLIDRFIHIYGKFFLNETEKEWFIKIATSGYILHPGRYVDHRLENNNARGYAKKDLNGDGTEELVLLNSDYTIVALFSMHEGKPILLQEFWNRCKGMIDKNGYVHIFGSGGADVQSHEIYKVADGGGSLEPLYEFGLDGHEWVDDVAVTKYYKTENGEKKYITEEEYNTILEQSNEYLGNKSITEVTKTDSGLQFRSLFSPTLNFSTYENILDSLRFMTSMYNYYKIGEAKREDFEYRYDLTTEENRKMYESLDKLVYTWYPSALGASFPPENAFAYAIKDLDGDDIDELIIIEGDRCDAIAVFTEKDGRIIFDNSYSFDRPSGEQSLKLAYWKNTVGLDLRPLYKNSVAFDLDYKRREAMDAIAWALTGEQRIWVPSSEEHISLADYVANTPSGKKPLSEIEDIKYAFVDMNGDTVDELIIDCGELIMLKFQITTVYLYQLSSDQVSELNTDEFLTLDELYADMISPIDAIEIGREYWKDRSLEVSLGFKSAYYTESLGDAPDSVYIVQLLERDSYYNPTCIDEIWVDKATGNIQSPYGAK